MPKTNPYANAARLPEGEHVDARSLVRGSFLELEIGPGRGGFLFGRAAEAPDVGLVGLEVRKKWAAIVDGRLAKQGLGDRARVFADDAKLALPRLGPDGVFRRVFLHFPDPWWKKRHEKRLVMGDKLLAEIARLLEPQGELFIQTDVEDRAAQYATIVSFDARFVPAGDKEGSPVLAESPFQARSPREVRAIADGIPIYRMLFRRA